MIISANRNPKNDSTYARRRSIMKGRVNQLEREIQGFKKANDKVVFEEFSPKTTNRNNVLWDFMDAWGLAAVNRDASGVLGVYRVSYNNEKARAPALHRIPDPELKSDFKLMLDDFSIVARRRFQGSDPYGYICVFVGKQSLDLICSKWGGNGKHHFYHWQAITSNASMANAVTIDDATAQDDDGTSEEGADKTGQVVGALEEALPFM
jgi:hypothetical protein